MPWGKIGIPPYAAGKGQNPPQKRREKKSVTFQLLNVHALFSLQFGQALLDIFMVDIYRSYLAIQTITSNINERTDTSLCIVEFWTFSSFFKSTFLSATRDN